MLQLIYKTCLSGWNIEQPLVKQIASTVNTILTLVSIICLHFLLYNSLLAVPTSVGSVMLPNVTFIF